MAWLNGDLFFFQLKIANALTQINNHNHVWELLPQFIHLKKK